MFKNIQWTIEAQQTQHLMDKYIHPSMLRDMVFSDFTR